jgi:prepilin-type N-terminal cleavage/methylation domain-containing protein
MRKHKNAFTLVELLVVIAIISLLMSILMPTLNRTRRQAHKVACLSNLRQHTLGIVMYTSDNNGYVPYGARVSRTTGIAYPPDYGIWFNSGGWMGIGKLYDLDYITDEKIFYCPATQTIAKREFNKDYEWEFRNGGSFIRSNYTHRGYFDWKLDSPETAPYTQADSSASHYFTPKLRPYSMLSCWTYLGTGFAPGIQRTGHFVLGGTTAAYSDGGIKWVRGTVTNNANITRTYWKMLDDSR